MFSSLPSGTTVQTCVSSVLATVTHLAYNILLSTHPRTLARSVTAVGWSAVTENFCSDNFCSHSTPLLASLPGMRATTPQARRTTHVRQCQSRSAPVGENQSSTNFPPPNAPDQRYRATADDAEAAATLTANAASLHLEVRPSLIAEAGRGIFATRDFEDGTVIGYMWGKFVEEESWQSIKRGVDPTHRSGEEDFVAPVNRGIWCCIAVDQLANGCDRLLASRQCPMAYINHTDSSGAANVSLDATMLEQLSDDVAVRYKHIPIRCTRRVARGEELLSQYGWSPADWNEVARRRAKRHRVQPRPPQRAPSLVQSGDHIHPLMDGAPPYKESLQAQRRNLVDFVQQRRNSFDKLRYHPWTRPTQFDSAAAGLPTTVRASSQIPGTMGVFLQTEHAASSTSVVACNYGGVLLSSELLDEFALLYHLPTAVRTPALDYTNATGHKVEMNIIGDPTLPAPTVNDGSRSRLANNCRLVSVSKHCIGQVLQRDDAGGKFYVADTVVQVVINPGVKVGMADEILVAYDEYGEGFWNQISSSDEYCSICFSKDATPASPMLQCEGNANQCRVSRHLSCFPYAAARTSSQLSAIHFFCPEHMDEAELAATRPPESPPRGIDYEAHHVFTPPPSRSPLPSSTEVTHVFTPVMANQVSTSSCTVALGASPDPFNGCVFTPPPAHVSPNAQSESRGPRSITSRSILSRLNTAAAPRVSAQLVLPEVRAVAKPQVATPPSYPINFEGSAAESIDLASEGYAMDDVSESASEVDAASDSEGSSFSADSDSESSDSARSDDAPLRSGSSRRIMAPAPDRDVAVKCPTISIRDEKLARALPDFPLAHVPLTEPQIREIQQCFQALGTKRWFAQVPRPQKQNPATPPIRHSSAMSISSDAASLGSTAQERFSVNRWRDLTAIAFDYAEYRSCCGSQVRMAQLLSQLSQTTAAAHSSLSPNNLIKFRIKYRSGYASSADFRASIQGKLAESINGTVHCDAGTVCTSCFRAMLGVGRTMMFSCKKAPTVQAQEHCTVDGLSRQKRQTEKLAFAMSWLEDYIGLLGECIPNPKSTKLGQSKIVLPFISEKPMREALNEFIKTRLGTSYDATQHVVKKHTLSRARDAFKANGKFISIAKSKQMCRCNDCETLDNKIAVASREKNEAAKRLHQAEKQSHLRAAQQQREYFDKMKVSAVMNALAMWCITFDGMDQSKTKLPSRKRYAKDLEPLPRLGLHVIGAFCFGGPLRVLGLFNYPDVRKDSNLSCTILERILDLQYRALGDDPGSRWPARIHVTFDNTASEAKNQYFFRFLGLLVLHGVFEAITVSNLLVGHTHDIVDQMFSVWAKMLRITDCATFSQMQKLFSEKYRSRILSLVNLIRGQMPIPDSGFEPDAEDTVREAQADPADPSSWSSSAADALEAFANELQDDIGMAPTIVLQTFSADIKRWLAEIDDAKRQQDPASVKRTKLEHLANAHVFSIHRDAETGEVWLYNKFMASSTRHSHSGEQHHYCGEITGDYSTRTLLWCPGDASAAIAGSDPARCVAPQVDTSTIRDTFQAFRAMDCLTDAEHAELNATLKNMGDVHTENATACATCAEFIKALADIGVISQKKSATEAEKKATNKKTNARKTAQNGLAKHLKDPGFAVEHAHLRCTGWFTKWITRVEEHIRPGYEKRGIRLPQKYVDLPYHIHPAVLCSGPSEKAVKPSTARVDLGWLANNGPPKKGDVIVLRRTDPREPFMIGQIVEFVLERANQYHHEQTSETPAPAAAAASSCQPAAATVAPNSTRRSSARNTRSDVSYEDPDRSESEEDPETDASDQSDQADEDFDASASDDSDQPYVALHRSSIVPAAASPASAAASSPASAASASQHRSGAAPEFGVQHRTDRRRTNLLLEDLPSVRVHWYDVAAKDMPKLHLRETTQDNEWWDDQHTANNTTAGDDDNPPEWVVNLYKPITFLKKPTADDDQVYGPATFILWGRKDKIFTQKGVLLAAVFDKIRVDLTGSEEIAAQTRSSKRPVSATASVPVTKKSKTRKAAPTANQPAGAGNSKRKSHLIQ